MKGNECSWAKMNNMMLTGMIQKYFLWGFVLLLSFASESALAQQKLLSYPSVLDEKAQWSDGDSFLVILDGKEGKRTETIRLYYVDCPETHASSKSDKQRVRAQARHFGLEQASDAILFGLEAKKRVAELLSKSFTVHTSGAKALGRSRKPRIYGMITLNDGRDLAAVLVEEGLARVLGVKKTRPDGTKSGEYTEYLKDLELSAAVKKKGVWAKSDPEKIVALRKKEREDAQELDKILEDGVFSAISEENPININTASIEELKQLRGIGDVTAKKIIAARPYTKVEDLTRVNGIGSGMLGRIRKLVKVK